jgi:allophanate hydrolase subunit 2
VRWTRRARGARAYLAISGGIAAPRVFGSAATDLGAGLGGLDGKPLRSGQSIPLAPPSGPSSLPVPSLSSLLPAGELEARCYADPFRLRFIPAPAASPAALAIFTATPYRLTPQSNRMGFRFDGGSGAALPVPPSSAERISEPLPAGTIQVPGDGRPILLMADRQTVGGYLALGYVIRADLARAAQLWPGDTVHFVATSLPEAEAASRQQGADLSALISG